uniref:NrsF family protein n=1 Tax=Pseudacidovorax intermedius TaxID=433924 RepID=UPI0005C29EB9
MKTDDLVTLLAQDAAPVPAAAASRRLWLALACSLPLSLLIMQAGYGMRGDLWRVMALPMLWVKLAVSLCVAAAGLLMVRRLAS